LTADCGELSIHMNMIMLSSFPTLTTSNGSWSSPLDICTG